MVPVRVKTDHTKEHRSATSGQDISGYCQNKNEESIHGYRQKKNAVCAFELWWRARQWRKEQKKAAFYEYQLDQLISSLKKKYPYIGMRTQRVIINDGLGTRTQDWTKQYQQDLDVIQADFLTDREKSSYEKIKSFYQRQQESYSPLTITHVLMLMSESTELTPQAKTKLYFVLLLSLQAPINCNGI